MSRVVRYAVAGALLYTAAVVVAALVLGDAIECDDSPDLLHCTCYRSGARCCWCEFGDGGHAPR